MMQCTSFHLEKDTPRQGGVGFRMAFYSLHTRVAVGEAGRLTRAAAKRHVSQPAVSVQIRALEDELEPTLFERSPAR